MENLSDEVLCAAGRRIRELLPHTTARSLLDDQRLGEEQLLALIQESLSAAHESGAIETKHLQRVAMDSTVPAAIAHPTDARLMHRALEKLVTLAPSHRVVLRQSYLRVAKRTLPSWSGAAITPISSGATG